MPNSSPAFAASSEPAASLQDIAVCGFSCRFAGDAVDSNAYWRMLCEARNAHSRTTRFGDTAPYPGHYLQQDVFAFDAHFFGISGTEATAMDPSQRLMLEVTYEAFENSGMPLERVCGSNTSCYVGQFATDYREVLFRDLDAAPTYTVSGTGTSFVSNRLSWFFDLKGPSFTLNTACSSSMVALHQACESLRSGESTMSVVGGSNLILAPEMFTFFRHQSFLAADGKCKSFDRAADGYGRGEGVAAIILKPVTLAIRDGDPIRAVIRASGVNQNGRTKGITLPSTEAQIELIKHTYASAHLSFDQTTYVDAHGTGTAAGDPMELEALGRTIGQRSSSPLLVGSSKPNIGHTEATSGLASLIKGVCALEAGLLPPNIYFTNPNPNIKFDEWNLEIPLKLTPWPLNSGRRMSLCSTGYSGTNAHIVMDDAYSYLMQRGNTAALHFTSSTSFSLASELLLDHETFPRSNRLQPYLKKTSEPISGRLFLFSSRDEEGCKRQVRSFAEYIAAVLSDLDRPKHVLRDLAYTLSNKRTRLPWSLSIRATSLAALQTRLLDETTIPKPRKRGEKPGICFCFSGQGAQWASMGKELYDAFTIFQNSVDRSGKYLRDALGCTWDAITEMFAGQQESRLDEPTFSQTLCTILQIAVIDQLVSWNIRADYVVGHSSGEISAAYACGALTREDALVVAYYRGLLLSRMLTMSSGPAGAMLAVGMGDAEAQVLINQEGEHKVVIACINSPNSVTLSGHTPQIERLEKALTERSIFARKLKVPTAYHSPHMEQIASDYVYAIGNIRPKDPDDTCKMFSSVTADVINPGELGPLYWMKNLISPVHFYGAVQRMLDHALKTSHSRAIDAIIELGPHSTLSGPLKQILQRAGVDGVDYVSTLSRAEKGVDSIMNAVGHLVSLGVPIDLVNVNEGSCSPHAPETPRMLPDLPPYTWNHAQSYSSLSRIERLYQRSAPPLNSGLLGRLMPSIHDSERVWRGYLAPESLQWIRDHQIETATLFPAAAYLVLVVEAAQQNASKDKSIAAFCFRDVFISSPCIVSPDEDVEIIVRLRPQYASLDWLSFTVSSCSNGTNLRENCSGLIQISYTVGEQTPIGLEKVAQRQAVSREAVEIEQECQQEVECNTFYADLARLGYRYGERFRLMRSILVGAGQSSCKITTQSWFRKDAMREPDLIHPATLDTVFQSIFAACHSSSPKLNSLMLPTSIDEVTLYHGSCAGQKIEYRGVAQVRQHGLRELKGSISMFNSSTNELLIQIKGLRVRSTGGIDESGGGKELRPVCTQLEWQLAADMKPLSMTTGLIADPDILLMLQEQSSTIATSIAASIHERLRSKRMSCRAVSWPAPAELLAGRIVISLLDLDKARFASPSASDFEALRATITGPARLIWISPMSALGSIVVGLARSVRNEIPSLNFHCVQVDLSEYDELALVNSIISLATCATQDSEFSQQGTKLLVPRYAPHTMMDTAIADFVEGNEKIVFASLQDLGDKRKVHLTQPGVLNSLCYAAADTATSPLLDDEVEIEVRASGLNFRDISIAMGDTEHTNFGLEASGIVTSVGKCAKRYNPGDSVCALGHGGLASSLRVKECFAQVIPAGMTFEEAATIPYAHTMAYYALVHVARAENGQSVLIHAAANAVGQATVQLAQSLGVDVYTTVASQEEHSLLKERYSIPDERILSNKDESFAMGVMRMTNGLGVDIILSCVDGELLHQSFRCVARLGTVIHVGHKELQQNTRLNKRPFLYNATLCYLDPSSMIKQRPKAVASAFGDCFELCRKSILRPITSHTIHSIAEVSTAFSSVQADPYLGAAVLRWDRDVAIPALMKPGSELKLSSEGSYLLAGGLGGIGRSLAHQLATWGARHILFISRSGAASSSARQVLSELKRRGVQASSYEGDISDIHSLEAALSEARKRHPPVKGVIQCAMVLRDVSFETMTHDDWVKSLLPKVQGSANLDMATRNSGCDFFIMLSSFAGVFGNRTQSNYAAACAFQDALAFERRGRGDSAVAIDLGIMRDVGYLAEHQGPGILRQWEPSLGLREDELRALVYTAITSKDVPAQIVTGLGNVSVADAAGIERPFYFNDPRFSILLATSTAITTAARSDENASLQDKIARTSSASEAQTVILDALVARLAKSLQVAASDIDVTAPLHNQGVDSLVAVEIRNWLFQVIRSDVSLFDLTATIPVLKLVELIANRCELLSSSLRV